MKKLKNLSINDYRKILFIAIIVFIVLSLLLFFINRNRDYQKMTLNTNNNKIFSIADLTFNDLKYMDSEKKIRKEFGKPIKEKSYIRYSYKYKKLYYKDVEFTLRENYNSYMLIGVNTKSRKYNLSRNIKVGSSVLKAMKKFKIDNKNGIYLYGNYSKDALNSSEIKNEIYFGVRGKKEITYVNRDYVVDSGNTNISRLTISYKRGKITKIMWIYDYE